MCQECAALQGDRPAASEPPFPLTADQTTTLLKQRRSRSLQIAVRQLCALFRVAATLEDVQRAAGHSGPSTTKLYDWDGYNPEKSQVLRHLLILAPKPTSN
jgi:hypothetical protein